MNHKKETITETKDKPEEVPAAPQMIEFSKFFTFISFRDRCLMYIGIFCSLVAGFLLPCISIAMGEVTNTYDPRKKPDDVLDDMRLISIYICLTGIATWLFSYIYYAFWEHLA
jgi:ATP-binding cassette subfamily B (MDR/TAP) protein 1